MRYLVRSDSNKADVSEDLSPMQSSMLTERTHAAPMAYRNIVRWTLALVGAYFIASATSAFASDARTIADSGNSAGAPACAACHGKHGEGLPELGYPRLAGLNAGYLLDQLNDFASGQRVSEIMQPVAKALTPEERRAMGSYYASLAPAKAAGEKPSMANGTAGEALARRGDWSKGVPACDQCHGPNGEGVGTAFPKLAGQSAAYIVAQLSAWKKNERTNDPLHLMGGIASKLDDQQMAAVAAYYAGLNPLRAAAQATGARQ